MKNRRLSLTLFGSSLIFFTASAQAGDVIKANNTDALNLSTSWLSGSPIPPDSTAVAVWDNTVLAANATSLGANTSWQGIRIANPGGLVTINNGSTLTLGSAGIDFATSAGLTIKCAVTLGSDQSFVIGNGSAGQDLLFDSPSSGLAFNMGGFTVGTSGAGTSRFTSGYTISNGVFNLNNANSEFQSGGGRTTTLDSDVTLNLSAGKQLTFGINSGPGLVVNSAAAINIGSGTLQINSSGASGTNRMEQTGTVSFTGTSTVNNAAQFSYFTNFTGEIALAGTTTWNSSGSSNANTTISGPLTGNGTLNYRGTSSAHRTDLTGDNSGFTGTINLDGGSGNRNLRLTSSTAGSSSAIWAPAAGNTLEIDGVSVDIGTLNGAGSVTNSHASNVAAISVGSGTFSGVISNGAPADGMALTKTGVGTLALTGANSYTGLTDIQGGTLTTTTAETGGGAMTVADTATLGITQLSNGATFNASTLTMGSTGGSTLELTPAAAPSTALVTTGTFTVNGATTLRLKGLPVAGTTLVSYTTLNGTSGFAGLSLAMPFRIGGTLGNTGSAITLATVTDETPKWRNGDGVWDINTTGNWKTSATSTTTNYLEGGPGATDSVIFDGASSGTSPITVTLNTTVSPVAITVAGAKNYILSGSGTIAGTAGISKSGASALTLATANTFSGGVLLNEGTLNVNHATALGSGSLTIAGGTVLNNTSGSAKVATNAQIWNGNFSFTGSNDLTLGNAAMTTSTAVTVSAGTLSVGGIAGSGFDLTKEGAGTLALGATSSYSGSTFVNNGVLKATAANSFSASSSVSLADVAGVALDLNGFNQTVKDLQGGGTTGGNVTLGGGILTVNTTSDSTFDGDLAGAGGLTKTGSAIFTIAGDKSGYTGATSVTGGTLDLDTISGYFGPTVTVTGGTADNSIIVGGGLFVQGNGTLNTGISGSSAGFGARGGNLTVNVGGAGAMINRNSGGTLGLGQMILGSPTSDSKVIIQNEMGINNFGGTRDITVNPGTGTASAEIAGAITPGTAGGKSGIVKKGTAELILSGLNTYTGDTIINEGSVTLAATGQLTFVPTTNGTVNKIRGVGSVTLNGAVSFNLAGANTTPGNIWKIVDDTPITGLASNTIGGTFSVVGFDDTDMNDVWTKVDGGNLWTFTESSRELSVQAAPAGFSTWIAGTFANPLAEADRDPTDDPDNDGIINLVEYAIAGQDPTVGSSIISTFTGNTLSFDKRLPLASDLTYAIEVSIDLGTTPWAEAPVGPNYVNDGTTISYQLPGTNPKDFMRLKVTKNP